MKESEFVSPWIEDSDERFACTYDIREELKKVKPYSLEEFSLCWEAALDKDRPMDDRERYLLARFGKEYVDSPDNFNQKIDNLEQRLSQNVGDFVLIQKSPTTVFLGRIASPETKYVSKIGGMGFPYTAMGIELSSVIGTIIDKDSFEIVPELTRDFVEVKRHFFMVAEGSTQKNWKGHGEGELYLDPDKPYYHEGDEYGVHIGMGEISEWQMNNLRWAEHVDNMMGAWNTKKLINIPVAKKKIFDSSLHLLDDSDQ